MMIASPTAASAAATVITMKTNNWPPMSPKKPDSETSVRLTAFNISSMHRNIVIALRLMKTPTAPIVNSKAESPKYHDNGTIAFSSSTDLVCVVRSDPNRRLKSALLLVSLASCEHHRPHDRHQDQHRSHLERKQVVGEQVRPYAPGCAD